jgi:hypothetical protein
MGSAGVLGIFGIGASLLPGSLTSGDDVASVHIAALVTQSTIIVVAIIASSIIFSLLIRDTRKQADPRLEFYRESLVQTISTLTASLDDESVRHDAEQLLRGITPPSHLEGQHKNALAALAALPNGTATSPIFLLTNLLVATSLRGLKLDELDSAGDG